MQICASEPGAPQVKFFNKINYRIHCKSVRQSLELSRFIFLRKSMQNPLQTCPSEPRPLQYHFLNKINAESNKSSFAYEILLFLHHLYQKVKFCSRNIAIFASRIWKSLVFLKKYCYFCIMDSKKSSFAWEILLFLHHVYQKVKFCSRNIAIFASWTAKSQVLLEKYCYFCIMNSKKSSFA